MKNHGRICALNGRHPVSGLVAEDASVSRLSEKRWVGIIADGVTRDPLPTLPDRTTAEGRRAWKQHYPIPSPAAQGAQSCVSVVSALIAQANTVDENTIYGAVSRANLVLGAYNLRHFPNPDFLVNDEAAVQLAAGIVDRDRFFYAFLSSCGVAVIDARGDVRFKTPDEYWSTDEKRHHTLRAEGLASFVGGRGNWSLPETREALRRRFRNVPGVEGGYGVLTGGQLAMQFVRRGNVELSKGDTVVVYSDGVGKIIFKEPLIPRTSLVEQVKCHFTRRDFRGLQDHCNQNIGSEGSLAYHVVH